MIVRRRGRGSARLHAERSVSVSCGKKPGGGVPAFHTHAHAHAHAHAHGLARICRDSLVLNANTTTVLLLQVCASVRPLSAAPPCRYVTVLHTRCARVRGFVLALDFCGLSSLTVVAQCIYNTR